LLRSYDFSAVDALTHDRAVFEKATLHAELPALDAHFDPTVYAMLKALIMDSHSVPIP